MLTVKELLLTFSFFKRDSNFFTLAAFYLGMRTSNFITVAAKEYAIGSLYSKETPEKDNFDCIWYMSLRHHRITCNRRFQTQLS